MEKHSHRSKLKKNFNEKILRKEKKRRRIDVLEMIVDEMNVKDPMENNDEMLRLMYFVEEDQKMKIDRTTKKNSDRCVSVMKMRNT